MIEVDKNGTVIREGDILYHPLDAVGWYEVIADANGDLYLGDYRHPLAYYSTHIYWLVAEETGVEPMPAGSKPAALSLRHSSNNDSR